MQNSRQSPPGGELAESPIPGIAQAANVGVCVIELTQNLVVFQNGVCEKICGKQQGRVCNSKAFRFCETRPTSLKLSEGMQLSACEESGTGRYFDVVSVNNGQCEVLLLYPLDKRLRQESSFFDDMGLSRRQLEIVHLMIQRQSNPQICEKLGISENTLRTHLKNIYKKVSPKGKQVLLQMRKIPF